MLISWGTFLLYLSFVILSPCQNFYFPDGYYLSLSLSFSLPFCFISCGWFFFLPHLFPVIGRFFPLFSSYFMTFGSPCLFTFLLPSPTWAPLLSSFSSPTLTSTTTTLLPRHLLSTESPVSLSGFSFKFCSFHFLKSTSTRSSSLSSSLSLSSPSARQRSKIHITQRNLKFPAKIPSWRFHYCRSRKNWTKRRWFKKKHIEMISQRIQ